MGKTPENPISRPWLCIRGYKRKTKRQVAKTRYWVTPAHGPPPALRETFCFFSGNFAKAFFCWLQKKRAVAKTRCWVTPAHAPPVLSAEGVFFLFSKFRKSFFSQSCQKQVLGSTCAPRNFRSPLVAFGFAFFFGGRRADRAREASAAFARWASVCVFGEHGARAQRKTQGRAAHGPRVQKSAILCFLRVPTHVWGLFA